METYDALAALQASDPRLRIHSISTATDVNMAEIRRLTTYLYERCPQMDHHNLAIIRGDRKNPTLRGPSLQQYEELYAYIRRLWAPREAGRYGSAVEPMLQWAKVETVKQERQVVPCKAGRISGVVYANGDVGVCEIHKPIGNLRQKPFPEIWHSPEARALRESIARRECYCTTEVFLWSSIVYQPLPLVQATVKGRVWRRPPPLNPSERAPVTLADGPAPAAGAPAADPADRLA
jgi:MoaA/NifB/PqqE/SkfB family radical SAM enzyme